MFTTPKPRHDKFHTQTNHLLNAMINGIQIYLKNSEEKLFLNYLDFASGIYGETGKRRAKKILYILQNINEEFSRISDNKEEVTHVRLKALFLLRAVFTSTSKQLENDFFMQLLGINSDQLEHLYLLQHKHFFIFKERFEVLLKTSATPINQIFGADLALQIFNTCNDLSGTLHGVVSSAFFYLNSEDTKKAIEKIKNALNNKTTSVSAILEYLNKAVLISDVRSVELVTYKGAVI